MDLALFMSALLLGLAGTPHCMAMCGGPCAALGGTPGTGQAASFWAFHLARLASYSAGGAVVAGSVGALAMLAAAAPALRPLWTLVHAAALSLGLYLLWRGQQPAWMERLGRGMARSPAGQGGWQRLQGPVRAGAAGSLWVAWPCGLLQSALMVAALANHAAAGAAVMAGFAAASGLGLALGPGLWLWFVRSRGGTAGAGTLRWQQAAVRLAGAMLAAASAWALGHDLIRRVVAYCIG